MRTSIELKSIHPQGGDQRNAFEELSFQLFARQFSVRGAVIRRHGAGGDAGLEGVVVDSDNRVLIGLQAKFFNDKLESKQWSQMDESIQTALNDNATDSTLQEIIVSIPRNLTQSQFEKWTSLRDAWTERAAQLLYPRPVEFTLWDESGLRGKLLADENRGLLLHYFDFPDFDLNHCRRKTISTVSGLGERYLPALHTTTDAEDKLHCFLRSERCRKQFLEQASENLRSRALLPKTVVGLPEQLHGAFREADSAWQRVLPLFGDGTSLPPSFSELSAALTKAADSLVPLMEGLSALIPPRDPRAEYDSYSPHSLGPHAEMLRHFDRWESHLCSLASYLEVNSLADHPCLLLSGSPGTGKTHVLAEVCSRYIEQGGVALFVEGAKFSTDEPPWTQFMRWAEFSGGSARGMIEMLSAMAEATSLPALICIDALNETPNRSLWRNGLLDFASEFLPGSHVKLLVTCRNDYVEQTLPPLLREQKTPGWAFAGHQGLGIEVFEAFPKYVAAYDVKWHGLPPLVQEFKNPLFLRIFCEAHKGSTPEPGAFSLEIILRRYVQHKAELLGRRIDCDSNRVLDALRDLANLIQKSDALRIPESDARAACERYHAPTEVNRSLYRALLSEGILAEYPDSTDALGSKQLVRFTYERIWDYFVSITVLPPEKPLSSELIVNLRDARWRRKNSGLVSLLNVRFPEEERGEFWDVVMTDGKIAHDSIDQFLDSLPWRTHKSVTPRTLELFKIATSEAEDRFFDHIVPLAPNPTHPWNADWLHSHLAALPLAERDRTWTCWVNKQLFWFPDDSPLREIIAWAERARVELLGDESRLLLASVLAWCSATTVIEARRRLSAAITRLLAGRTQIASRLVQRFLLIDDPYIREWVLLAAAGAAQHASAGDVHLGELARVVHASVFSGKIVEPHLLIRHYATEVCRQAETKGVLPTAISPASFRPPFHSHWPRIWSEKKCDDKKKSLEGAFTFFQSVVPDCGRSFYGDWGRYVMQGYVEQFLPQKLLETVEPFKRGYRPRFDAMTARRFVIQRVFEIGWDPQQPDNLPDIGYDGRGRPKVERLSKKYQWIALYEFLGFLSDHYHLHDYDDPEATFNSASQLIGSGLLDPFVIDAPPASVESSWDFVQSPAPWWRGHLDLLPRPLSESQQREDAERLARIFHPINLLVLNNGTDDWFTLSAFHQWNEPKLVWALGENPPYLNIEIAIQSYLVGIATKSKLIAELNERGLDHDSRLWLEEPDFGQPLAALRTFPLNQDELRHRCELDERYATEEWCTGAISTTCRCAPDEEQRRARDGSMPSPQLAGIGNLRWLGSKFDFAPVGESVPVVRHVGKGFHGACIVRRESLLSWLQTSKLSLVWRFYIQKFLHNNTPDHNHSRAYWGTFLLRPDGEITASGGNTCAFPHGPGPIEPLPWKIG